MMVRRRTRYGLGALALSAVAAWTLPATAQPTPAFASWFAGEIIKWVAQGKEVASVAKAGGLADEINGIQGEYDAADYPVLASVCAADFECRDCLRKPGALLADEFFMAENNYVLYLRTMKKYEMMVALADAATSLPTEFARYAWLIQKGSPRSGMNVARKQFMTHYGEAQKKHLETINQALLDIARCEVPYDEGWFNRVGMPFYTQLLLRWTTVK